MRLAILGYGREGKSLEKFLKRTKLAEYRNAEIEILDQKTTRNYLQNLERFDLIFRSPGVPYNLPELVRLRALARTPGGRVKFSSPTRLFFSQCPAKIIGITGTKGKGTVATLLYRILRAAGRDVYLVGNIGKPALDILPRLKKSSLVVFELSSFQLQDLEMSPPLAVMLDVFPDHQDSHKNLREYYRAKSNIARYQKAGDRVFVFHDSPRARRAARGGGKIILVKPDDFSFLRDELEPTKLSYFLQSAHNFRNAAMALAVAKHLKITQTKAIEVMKRFRGLPHRLEFVRRIGRLNFFDDSAATNPTAAAAAARSLSKLNSPLALIAGGQSKNLDYRPLARALKNYRVPLIVLYGENRRALARSLVRNEKTKVSLVPTLDVALARAAVWARQQSGAVTILFSPGAASFDQFVDYEARGKYFQQLVRKL